MKKKQLSTISLPLPPHSCNVHWSEPPFFPQGAPLRGFCSWNILFKGETRKTNKQKHKPGRRGLDAEEGAEGQGAPEDEDGRAASSALPPGVSGRRGARHTRTHRDALPHDAALLHPPGAPELLHVLAEVALSALGPQAGLALAASRPAPASSRRCPVGGQLHGGGRAQLPLGPTYRPVLRESTQDREMGHRAGPTPTAGRLVPTPEPQTAELI